MAVAQYGSTEERGILAVKTVAGGLSAGVLLGVFSAGLTGLGLVTAITGGPAGWVAGGVLIVVGLGVGGAAVKAVEVQTGSDFNLPFGL